MTEIHPEFARSLLEVMPVGVALVDTDHRILWANEALAALTGQSVATLAGADVTTLNLPVPAALTDGSGTGERVFAQDFHVGIAHRFGPMQGNVSGFFVLHRATYPAWTVESAAREYADVSASVGLLSREAAVQRITIEISRSRRYENPLSCVIARIHDSKEGRKPNARVSHGLLQLSRLLKDHLRWVDVLGRWAVDTLVLILPETSAEAVAVLTAKLAARSAALFAESEEELVTVWGAATWRKGDDALRLIKRAELVCFEGPSST